MNPVYLTLIIIVALGLLIFVLRAVMRTLLISAVRAIREHYPSSTWIRRAHVNFFGIKSKGLGQVRGNGILVLTAKMLVFRQLAPGRTIEIPVDQIKDIEHPRHFLGKTKMRELLVVNFANDVGEADAVGFLVNNPREWADEILSLKSS